MKTRLTYLLLFTMLFAVMLIIPRQTVANDEVVEIDDGNSTISSKQPVHHSIELFSIGETARSSSAIDVDKTTSTRLVSAYASSQFFWLDLKDSMRNPVTGIKVSRIELIQDDTVVARANEVTSYSIRGQYRTNQLEVFNEFKNPNGENLIDIVLYLGSKEVARLKNYKIHVYEQPIVDRIHPTILSPESLRFRVSTTLVNVDQVKLTDFYLVDENGNRITKTDKIVEDYYRQSERVRNVDYAISFIDSKYLAKDKSYDYVVEVDGQKVQTFDNHPFRTVNFVTINTITHSKMPKLEYKVKGINLINHGPYKLVIEQEGEVTKELTGVSAKFNENDYSEEIKLDLPADYFKNYGSMYNVKVYNADNEQINDFTFLPPKDETNKEENDITDPFEGFKVFDKKENVEPQKTWRVTFNKAVDHNTIHNGNTYIVNKRTGQTVKVDYQLESNGTVLAMMPEKNFTSGETYTLIIDKRVKSGAGINLSQPAAIEFTVK